MKKLIFLFFTLLLTNCASLTFEENPPFNITKATYKESVKEIVINYTSESTVEFLNAFFRNHKLKINKREQQPLIIKFNKLQNMNLQFHGDSKKEFGNKAPKEDFPFKLNYYRLKPIGLISPKGD